MGSTASQGKLNLNELPGHYTFTYQTSLPHLIWNEYHDANTDPDPTKYPPPAKLWKPGPYEFQVKWPMAFVNFAKSVDLPKCRPHLSRLPKRAGVRLWQMKLSLNSAFKLARTPSRVAEDGPGDADPMAGTFGSLTVGHVRFQCSAAGPTADDVQGIAEHANMRRRPCERRQRGMRQDGRQRPRRNDPRLPPPPELPQINSAAARRQRRDRGAQALDHTSPAQELVKTKAMAVSPSA